jgi:hypothetical protein
MVFALYVFISQLMVGWFIVLNTTFNKISVISHRSVLLVEETGVPGQNQRSFANLMTLKNKAGLIKLCTIIKIIENGICDSAKTYQPLFI